MDTVLMIGGADLLPRIEPLWCELRDLHSLRSAHFSDLVRDMEFESRRMGLLEKSVGGHILVQIVSLSGTSEPKDVAYCVSTVGLDGIAEIDSIYVAEGYRGMGLGGKLIDGALDWIDEHDVREVRTSVLWGNEEVLPFYQHHGLYPRSIVLLRK
ncbi:MAG: GNAT family N-acetyltransferase [Methanomassiliicoccales archaeon]|jgi:GNAT superfamily N-acetyltransferase